MSSGSIETALTGGGMIKADKELVARRSPSAGEADQISRGNFVGRLSLRESTEGSIVESALAADDYDYIFPEIGGPSHLLVPASSLVETLRTMVPEGGPDSAQYLQAAEAFVESQELLVIPLARAIRK